MIHIVCGIPGSGKTTVTRFLAEKLDAEVVNTDIVHGMLYPQGAHTSTGDFTPSSLEAVYCSLPLLAYYLAKIAPDKDIVIEGSFRLDSQRRAITSVLDDLKAQYTLLLVEVSDDEVIRKRLENRLETGHKGDFQHYLDIKKVYERPRTATIIRNNSTVENLEIQVDKYITLLNK